MSSIFEKRVERRRRWALIIGLIGAAFTGAVTYVLLFFALVVAVPLTDQQRSICVAIICVVVTVAYLAGWFARGFHAENIDSQISEMGPIMKQILIGAVQEQVERDKSTIPVVFKKGG